MPIKIYSMVRAGVSPDANALCAVIIVGTLLIMLVSTMVKNRAQKRSGY